MVVFVSISLALLASGLELLPYLGGEIFRQGNLGGFHPPRLSTAQDDILFFIVIKEKYFNRI
jgi:hypothetical protein